MRVSKKFRVESLKFRVESQWKVEGFKLEIEFMKKKKTKKQQFSSVKALLKADREREIETYGKQVSLRPSRVHKSKKDYDRKKNKVQERDLE